MFPASTTVWDTVAVQILGNNELSIRKIKDLLGINGNGPITTANAKHLYFYPKRKSNNHIYYFVSTEPPRTAGTGEKIIYPAVGKDTNPSPPDPPCTTCQ